MIAYVFWHAAPEGAAAACEKALIRFGSALAEARTPGFLGNASYAISGTPWMPETGYEDWAWLEGSWALDGLNERAVAGEVKPPHDEVARVTKHGGFGALYYLVDGVHAIPGDSKVFWLSRPRGIDWRAFVPGIVASAASAVSVWRRQMVLGPSTEFALVGAPGITLALPQGWRAVAVERRKLAAA